MNKYQQVAHDIENLIVKHNLKHGEKLLSLKQLESRYMVSKTTIISALHLLEERGKIFQVRGSGIFVRKPIRNDGTPLYLNQRIEIRGADYDASPELFMKMMILKDKKEVAMYIDFRDEGEIYFVNKIKEGEEKIKYLEKNYYDVMVSERLGLGLKVGIISENLTKQVEETISYTDIYIYSGTMTDSDATQLNMNHDRRALFIDTVYYAKGGQVFGFSKIIYPHGKSCFLIQTNKRNT